MELGKILNGPTEEVVSQVFKHENHDNEKEEYNLLAPMADFQKELTDAIVSLHYSDILKYYETDNKDDMLLIDSLKALYVNVQLVTSHPYLLIDHFMPKSLTAKDIPLKLIQTSGKFKVLKDILDIYSGVHDIRNSLKSVLSQRTDLGTAISKKTNSAIMSAMRQKMLNDLDKVPDVKNILIVARAGRTLDLLESLLLGLKLPYCRYSGNNIKNSKDVAKFSISDKIAGEEHEQGIRKKISGYSLNLSQNLKSLTVSNSFLNPVFLVNVHIISSDDVEQGMGKFMENYKGNKTFKVDLVIPFDLSVNMSCLQEVRGKNHTRKVKIAPVLRIFPSFTVDNIALNFNYSSQDDKIEINDTFRNIISAIVVERGKVGMVDINMRNVLNNNLEILKGWFLFKTDQKRTNTDYYFWSLPSVPKIPSFKPQDVEKSLLTEVKYQPEDDYSDMDEEIPDSKTKPEPELSKMDFYDYMKIKEERLKTANDLFYDSKRLTNHYLLNPIEFKNRSNIVGIEAESISVDNANYYEYLSKEYILTHFEIYEMNLRYLGYDSMGDQCIQILKTLSEIHLEDFEVNVKELSEFFAKNMAKYEKYNTLLSKKKFLQERVNKNDEIWSKLQAYLSANINQEDEWQKNQFKLYTLIHDKMETMKSLAVKENEFGYLDSEISKLDTLSQENEKAIATKEKELSEKLQQLQDFNEMYDKISDASLQDEKHSKRRKLNSMISSVDEMMLQIKHDINLSEETGKNRNRRSRK